MIAAMAETPNVMPQLHMPLQSGSDTVLKAMRRSYRQERYLGIIEKVRAAIPHAAITTDIIVGFPGETEEDFEQTMHVVREARFTQAFTFQYSKRPGTPAATMENQIPKEVVQARYERLVALQEEISWEENKKQVGRTLELMVAEGEGRKDGATHRLSGRAPDNRLVHFTKPDQEVRPGDVVTVEITYAAPTTSWPRAPSSMCAAHARGTHGRSGTRPRPPYPRVSCWASRRSGFPSRCLRPRAAARRTERTPPVTEERLGGAWGAGWSWSTAGPGTIRTSTRWRTSRAPGKRPAPACTRSPAPTVRASVCARSVGRSTGSVTGTPTTRPSRA